MRADEPIDGKDSYPDKQIDRVVHWATAVRRAHGWTVNSVVGHKEMMLRKIDPSFDMGQFRAKVAERLKHPVSWSPSTPVPCTPVKSVEDRLTELEKRVTLLEATP